MVGCCLLDMFEFWTLTNSYMCQTRCILATEPQVNILSPCQFPTFGATFLVAEDKTLGPTNCKVFLGLEINTSTMTVKILLNQIEQFKFNLLLIFQKRKVT